MVEVLSMRCPYCSKDVFFPADVESGYCSSCGKIIYTDGASKSSLTGSTQSTARMGFHSPHQIEYKLRIVYSKRALSSYNAAAEVVVEGPVSKNIIKKNLYLRIKNTASGFSWQRPMMYLLMLSTEQPISV